MVASVVAGAARVEGVAYTAALVAAGPYTKDQEQTAEILLEAKPGYHVNQEFPLQFKPVSDPAAGVTYAKSVGREGSTIQEAKATVKVPFTPTRTGTVKLAGTFSFSVCSNETCLREKKDLEVTTNVR